MTPEDVEKEFMQLTMEIASLKNQVWRPYMPMAIYIHIKQE